MHNLKPMTALGGSKPRIDTFSNVTISENDSLAIASVSARRGFETACHSALQNLVGSVPEPGTAVLADPMSAIWIGPDQWMITAPRAAHELLADDLKTRLGDAASVTEQTGAWVCFDVTGDGMHDLSERSCAVPIRRMSAGDAQRTIIHHLGCFVVRQPARDHIRILGPRASAGSLHHALMDAAHSIS